MNLVLEYRTVVNVFSSPDFISLHSYGGAEESYPHPELDFNGFIAAIKRENKRCNKVWDPVSKKMQSWIRPSRINRVGGGCSVM